MRLIVIDPQARTIEEKIEDRVDLASIKELVQPPSGALDSKRIAEFPRSWDYCWLDDTGLEGGPVYAFQFVPMAPEQKVDPCAGRAVIVGVNRETRASCNAIMPLHFIKSHVRWLGLIKPHVRWRRMHNQHIAEVTWESLS